MRRPNTLPIVEPIPSGTAIQLPKEWLVNNDERGVIARFILNKEYFGACFRQFHPLFFMTDTYKGVVVSMLVDSHELHPELKKPGDVDILIVPYTDKSLIFSEAIAIEAKVIRASYAKQAKSPNQYGFSQAQGLWEIGFPYVAVAHFVVSDKSPRDQWVKRLQATVGRNESIKDTIEVDIDYLPATLMDRALGRLSHNCSNDSLGLLSSYLPDIDTKSLYYPDGRKCMQNTIKNPYLIRGLITYYSKNYEKFFNIPRNPLR